ncbi:DUF5988 family protein [Streptomyces sp. NPDC056749]|uniref:DUF5988 family protein n=1 Tax=Streptomyces sp. NPDC056749 TaxID=3345936 RepID=UPI0036A19B46
MQRNAPEGEVEVLLSGGPDGVPGRISLPADELTDRLTVSHLNGREHFEDTDECIDIDGHSTPVYQWIYSTKIAE